MDKQIKELAEVLLFYNIIPNDELCDEVAEYIINAGYRRQEDLIAKMEEEVDGWERHYESLYETDKATIRTKVAMEIFEEIEINIFEIITPYKQALQCLPEGCIAELKKKYGVME